LGKGLTLAANIPTAKTPAIASDPKRRFDLRCHALFDGWFKCH
jgi:hypothetical protein